MLVGWWWGCWGILPGGSSTPFTSKLLLTPGLVLGHCGLHFGLDVGIQLVFQCSEFLGTSFSSTSEFRFPGFIISCCRVSVVDFTVLDSTSGTFLGRSFLDFWDSCCELQFQLVQIMLVIS